MKINIGVKVIGLVQPELGKTFQILREQGFNAFYKGDIAKQLVNVVKAYVVGQSL